ncbi:ROK family protein [Sphingorhabdus sp.]|uniref:ROK family protein n=1 Tax=Sphingorhabdus sp. TaxID=1902408 RepID=UPI0035939126
MSERLYGCVEAGGTKFVVGIAAAPDDIRETIQFETRTPRETIGATLQWLKDAQVRHGPLAAIGIASFGPLELDRQAANWGHITATTKKGWSDTDFGAQIGRELGLPVGFDTDVNGAAIAESRWGAGRGKTVCVYVTIGTGIGGGAIIDGKPLYGLSHPEMGHIRLPRHPKDMDFPGICSFHGDCLEGLASGPAIKARWGVSLSDLPFDHPAHDIISWYLAQMVVTLQSIMEPGCIILGGGVTGTSGLLSRIRAKAGELGGGYFRGRADEVIVSPGLGDRAGLLGGLALAQDIVKAVDTP